MYELYPYFTNDGSVGLFNRDEDDVYHSAYGALTEAWEKFILPSHFQQLLQSGNNIKIFDICYGIGYNTKAAIQIFSDNLNKKFFKKNVSMQKNIDTIDTDNAKSKFSKKSCCMEEKNTHVNPEYNAPVYTDKMGPQRLIIDAVDMDMTLIKLSPFITNKICKNSKNFNKKILNDKSEKLNKIGKILEEKFSPYKDEYKISDEVNLFLAKILIESDIESQTDKSINSILHNKDLSSFFDKNAIRFAEIYKNFRYKNLSEGNKLTLLHNIYYRYIASRYKLGQISPVFNYIDLNFSSMDARRFILYSDLKYNLMFLDAFTPSKCPMLWSLEYFRVLYNHLEDNGMILTYSSSAAVRNALLEAGLYVGKIYDSNLKKDIGTIAVKDKSLIQHELTEYDLGLMKTRAGIFYRDKDFKHSNEEILAAHKYEVDNSDLMSGSQYIKQHKQD